MMQTVLTQVQLPLALISLSAYIVHAHGSPLSDSNSSACPRGWYQYEQFCVTRGEGSSDRAVALYCDGFGGIGIKGLCIIKAPTDDLLKDVEEDTAVNLSQGFPIPERHRLEPKSAEDLRLASSSDRDQLLSPYRNLEDSAQSALLDTDVFGSSVSSEDGPCPFGWTHYRSMCVYKPWSVVTTCNLLDSVEFHGLCVRHADLNAVANRNLRDNHTTDKRICCCAHFNAKSNKYAC